MGSTGQSITLANSIIGVGILAMPFCFQQCGVLLATVILLFMGLVSRLCCYFLLKSALLARRRNFEFLAFHVFGPAGKLAVEVGIIGFLMGTCIAYFVVVGDLGPQIIAKMFNINQSDILRTSIMVVVSLVCILPLGLLRNVDSLSNVSAATIGFYLCLVIKVIAEATSQLSIGTFPAGVVLWRPAGLLQCVPIFSMALFCQTQLFEIFESLPSLSLEKMNVVTKNAIHICAGVYFTLGLFGYIAFSSQNISGNILMSLSETTASDVIKLGFVMSVAFSFPLIIFPCRASLYSLLYKKVHSIHHDHIINHSIPESSFRCITVAIIAISLFISLLIPNIELVLGLVGSTIGVLICMVFPAACFVNITFKNTNERILAKGVILLGLVIMVLGTYANLQAAETQPDRYDERLTDDQRIDKIVEDFIQKQQKTGSILKAVNNEAIPNPHEKDEVIKRIEDSEVQPPNPVPPESNSNEKLKSKDIPDENKENVERKAPLSKEKQTHPKNLQTKLSEAKNNADSNKVQNNKIAPKETSKETLQEKVRDQLDLMKQMQLIETIKQHGEEQKELLKEQKEILDKIQKTKEELQETKKEANDEAKKIAVESIQKIANIAIQSLSGVAEKPADNGKAGDKKLEPLEVIANQAVKEIAKQVSESIQAINDNSEAESSKDKKPDKKTNEPVVNNVKNAAVAKNVDQREIINNGNALDDSIINANSKINNNAQSLPNQVNSVNSIVKAESLPQNNLAQVLTNDNLNKPSIIVNENPQLLIVAQNLELVNNVPLDKQAHENNQVLDNAQSQVDQKHDETQYERKVDILKETQNQVNVQNIPIVQNSEIIPGNMAGNAAVDQAVSNSEAKKDKVQANLNVPILQNEAYVIPAAPKLPNDVNNNLEHSHSPDEPQSYKQGEEIQKNISESKVMNNIANNIPLAIAMNDQITYNQNYKDSNAQRNEYKNNNGQEESNVQLDKNLPKDAVLRQKREVVDGAGKAVIKPEDKAICKKTTNSDADNTLVHLPSKVDLSDIAFSNKLPVDMIHLVRSLKSYDETEDKR